MVVAPFATQAEREWYEAIENKMQVRTEVAWDAVPAFKCMCCCPRLATHTHMEVAERPAATVSLTKRKFVIRDCRLLP